jgi:transmembrane sensor
MFHPDKHVRDLISRFLDKKCTDEEIDELYQWIVEHDSHREYFDRVNESFQTQKVLDQFNPEKIDVAWQKFSLRLQEENQVTHKHKIISKGYYNFLRIAASVSLLVISSFLIYKIFLHHPAGPEKVVVHNPQSRNTYILLPDSTMVWLNANSTIEYAEDFGLKSREVTLKGEAFFDVTKREKMNFIVRTEEVSVRVKGTRFNVRAYQGEDIKTTLEEGKVELLLKGDETVYDMDPGDQVTVKKDARSITVSKVNTSNYTAWKEEELIFDNTKLSEIILKLENKYKVKISIDSALAERERLTMTIEQESIDEILEMIQLSSHLHVKRERDQIIIYE